MISSSYNSVAASASSRKKPRSGLQLPQESKWRSGAQQQIYGRRLLEALRATRGGGAGGTPPAGPQAFKDAAYSALALTARGQSRWSRSLLFGRCRRRELLLKAGGKVRRRRPPRPLRKIMAGAALEPPPALKGKKVRDRLRLLSKLIPGCRKLSTPILLEETADYVAALEMQVKTMRALTDALSAAALSSPTVESAPAAES
ncbi:transcription factor bHLH147-like isoform X2 [Phalaenopsis equestris]|uniref:transcription factor bHLH147-like isoform X1 n=1 Tax=Phalaenopsis equestris TaxID=78828 RepID=UPI0009E22C6E|nr:transcription factor bHLH147-like isoform X1 [Phalaenopsis equestris]XP_020598685.1 transcription factor bHLH147-like isoform X2 [Phalaenopsis equestris]